MDPLLEREATLVDDFRWEQDAQNRRAERFSGGNKTEHDSYFGKDGEGDGQERKLNYKDWLKWHKAPEEERAPWHEERAHGWEMGQRHGEDLDHAPIHEMVNHMERTEYPDHFFEGYSRGLESAVPKRIATLVAPDSPFKITAHVSGNQVDVLHCPFCGSGSVVGRSDGTIECGYCTSVFTVGVQPAYNGFPQSVDGQPYEWPGKPDPAGESVADPDLPEGTNLNPNTNGSGGFQSSDPADGGNMDEDGDEEGDDDDKPAFLKGKGDSDSGDEKSDDKKDKGKNPFAKKKSAVEACPSKRAPHNNGMMTLYSPAQQCVLPRGHSGLHTASDYSWDDDGNRYKPDYQVPEGSNEFERVNREAPEMHGDSFWNRTRGRSYRTATGATLDEGNYLAHLAIQFAKDKRKVASLVKASRKV
jgi:hypothetical protein